MATPVFTSQKTNKTQKQWPKKKKKFFFFNQSAKHIPLSYISNLNLFLDLYTSPHPHPHPCVPLTLPPPFITCTTHEYTGVSALSIYHYSQLTITIIIISKLYVLLYHSSGAVWESRWPSWAVRPNEPSGFRGRKAILNHASALVTACP